MHRVQTTVYVLLLAVTIQGCGKSQADVRECYANQMRIHGALNRLLLDAPKVAEGIEVGTVKCNQELTTRGYFDRKMKDPGGGENSFGQAP